MLFEIKEKTYRPAQPGEDFGEYEYTTVATIEAETRRAAQNAYKKQNPTARFSENGKFCCWQAR